MSVSTRLNPYARWSAMLAVCATLLLLPGVSAWAQSTDGESATRTASATTLSSADVRQVMGQHRLEVRGCFASADLPGRVDMIIDFTIGGNGLVQSASMQASNAANEQVESCVLDVFQSLAFPAPSNGRAVSVRYPLIFVTGT